MDKKEAQKELDALKLREAELMKIINAPEITPEERFLQLIDGLTIKIDKMRYPDSIFYLRNDKFMIEIERSKAFLNKDLFWDVFKKEFNMDNFQIGNFLKSMLIKFLSVNVLKVDHWWGHN
jgi:hypothetical protein